MMRAAWGLGAGQGASEAPVSVRILVERATLAGTQKTAARRESEVVCKWEKAGFIHRHLASGARRFLRDWR